MFKKQTMSQVYLKNEPFSVYLNFELYSFKMRVHTEKNEIGVAEFRGGKMKKAIVTLLVLMMAMALFAGGADEKPAATTEADNGPKGTVMVYTSTGETVMLALKVTNCLMSSTTPRQIVRTSSRLASGYSRTEKKDTTT